ncbi:MAG: hypothetical protein KA801_06550 [Syntrophorhabdaceae bacterium]|nr:hypothetical protein [Syntrophorhabdaceae bacterium]
MSIRNKTLRTPLSNQGDLFDIPLVEGSLDISLAFRAALSRVFSKCRDSRYQLAAKLSEFTKRNISKDALDKYTSSNLDYALRAEDLPATIAVTGSLEHVQVLLDPVGCSVVTPEDNKLLKLARLTQQRNSLSIEIARLESEMGITRR